MAAGSTVDVTDRHTHTDRLTTVTLCGVNDGIDELPRLGVRVCVLSGIQHDERSLSV